MEQEFWKDVKGFEGEYKVSSLGKIMRLKREGSNKESFCRDRLLLINSTVGYPMVCLRSQTGKVKNYLVHRLIAEHFIENDDPANKIQVNHKNKNIFDYSIENLEWCTRSENIIHSKNTKRPDFIKSTITIKIDHESLKKLRHKSIPTGKSATQYITKLLEDIADNNIAINNVDNLQKANSVNIPDEIMDYIRYRAAIENVSIEKWVIWTCGEKLHKLATEEIVELEFEEESFNDIKTISENEGLSIIEWIDALIEREIDSFKQAQTFPLSPNPSHLNNYNKQSPPRIDPNNLDDLKKRFPSAFKEEPTMSRRKSREAVQIGKLIPDAIEEIKK